MNPNNITSQYYDLVSSPLKSTAVTDEEISLVNRLVEPGSYILDIGAGTGRHALTLSKQGFNVTALDSSSEMLKILKRNDPEDKVDVIDKSIYRFTPSRKFDLIILFWNSFNEIALSKRNANLLLSKLKTFLNPSGAILVNIDDSTKVDPSNFNFETVKTDGEITYKMKWSTSRYIKKTNTSVSKEEVEIYKNDKLIDSKTTYIKQRYWSLSDITEMCSKLNLSLEKLNLKTSEELYLLFTLNK